MKRTYKEFSQGKDIIRKRYLNNDELEQTFNIIKHNMINLGFIVSNKDKASWCDNIKSSLANSNFYFYLVYLNSEIVAFFEVFNEKDTYIISEVQLADKVKRTKIILEIIKYLLNCNELSNVDEVYFSILKNNDISNKTFSHLGGKIVSENERKFKYVIKRDFVNSFISKFNI